LILIINNIFSNRCPDHGIHHQTTKAERSVSGAIRVLLAAIRNIFGEFHDQGDNNERKYY
jgi:hypothetical protein